MQTTFTTFTFTDIQTNKQTKKNDQGELGKYFQLDLLKKVIAIQNITCLYWSVCLNKVETGSFLKRTLVLCLVMSVLLI